MKIIGKTDDGFILGATCDELAKLVGYYFDNLEFRHETQLKVGSEIPISDIFNKLYNQARHDVEIKEVQKTLRKMINDLELVNPILESSS